MGLIQSLAFPEQDEGPEALIVDVEKVLGDQAWDSFVHSYSCFWRCCIKKKNFVVEVPMNYYYFEQGQPEVKLMESTSSANMLTTDANGKQGTSRRQGTPEMIGLETRFNNDTETEQKYNFNFQKERSASVEVTYQRGFSIGGKANFTLGIPTITGDGSLGAEIETYVEVTKTTGERHEERVTTSATSEITVAPHSHYTITVVMEERTLEAKFKVPVTMKLPADRGLVYIKIKKTGQVVYIQNVTSLPFYFTKFREASEHTNQEVKTHIAFVNARGEEVDYAISGEETTDNRAVSVRFTIEGIIKGVQLSTHCIKLKQTEADRGNNTDADSPQNGPTDVASRAAVIAGQRSGSRRDAARIQAEGRMLQEGPDKATSSRQSVIQVVEQRATDGVSIYFPNDS